jgi:hypothetical protein
MAKKKYLIALNENTIKRLEAIARIKRKKRDSLINEIFDEYLDRIVEEKGIDRIAIDRYINDKMDEKELALIVGNEKAKAAKITKRIGLKGKKFLKVFGG